MAGALTPEELDGDRLDRSRRVGWIDVDAVRSKRCLVVGAGALGNEVVKNLLLSGFGSVTIVDMDRVALTNLNRCMFFTSEDAELKRSKALVLSERARHLNPDASVFAFDSRIESIPAGVLREHDLVFGCLDNVGARLHLNAHAYHLRIPFIDGGTLGTRGKVQVVVPPDSPCLQCATNRTHAKVLEKRFSCSGNDVSYFQPRFAAEITTTSIIAALQVREGLKLASGHEDDCIAHILYYDGLRNAYETVEVSRDPECPVHA
ncbi:MAG TPA: ThiF family adenylyltransferase [Methanomassiliicoccales archaeon]|nr:ThiF family adenylyltransferase [Methanomassiliicoccales archaeon]